MFAANAASCKEEQGKDVKRIGSVLLQISVN